MANFNPLQINWEDTEDICFYDERWPQSWVRRLHNVRWPLDGGVIWISTSGTSSQGVLTFVALKKSSLLVSAKSVNKHIASSSQDCWLNALPIYHVGGVSVYARSYLSGACVEDISDQKWSPKVFVDKLVEKQITLTSLVPTQLYDLLMMKLSPPESLRVVFIGGAALAPSLYKKACELGWPILPTYGMTELGSQVATAPLKSIEKGAMACGDYRLEPLSHINIETDEHRHIKIKSLSAMSGRFQINIEDGSENFETFDSQSFYTSQDLGHYQNGKLTIIGRADESVKIMGEWVNVGRLNMQFKDYALEEEVTTTSVIVTRSHPRRGHEVVLVTELPKEPRVMDDKVIEKIVTKMNAENRPFERIQGVYWVHEIPKTALGKIKVKSLSETIS